MMDTKIVSQKAAKKMKKIGDNMVSHKIDEQIFLDGIELDSNALFHICNIDGRVLTIVNIRGGKDGITIYVK